MKAQVRASFTARTAGKGDEVYGNCTELRKFSGARGQAHVLRVRSNVRLTLPGGRRLTCTDAGSRLSARKHPEVRSAGKGSKGARWYAWSWLAAAPRSAAC